MKKFDYTIKDELGIHARPAGLLTKKAAEFSSKITLECGPKKGDAKKIMSIMMMAVKTGQTVTVAAEGEDEDAAIEAMEAFMKENL